VESANKISSVLFQRTTHDQARSTKVEIMYVFLSID